MAADGSGVEPPLGGGPEGGRKSGIERRIKVKIESKM
jgi:hypothetical protein